NEDAHPNGNGFTILRSRAKPPSLHGINSALIEAKTEAIAHAVKLHGSIGADDNKQLDCAFSPRFAAVIGAVGQYLGSKHRSSDSTAHGKSGFTVAAPLTRAGSRPSAVADSGSDAVTDSATSSWPIRWRSDHTVRITDL